MGCTQRSLEVRKEDPTGGLSNGRLLDAGDGVTLDHVAVTCRNLCGPTSPSMPGRQAGRLQFVIRRSGSPMESSFLDSTQRGLDAALEEDSVAVTGNGSPCHPRNGRMAAPAAEAGSPVPHTVLRQQCLCGREDHSVAHLPGGATLGETNLSKNRGGRKDRSRTWGSGKEHSSDDEDDNKQWTETGG